MRVDQVSSGETPPHGVTTTQRGAPTISHTAALAPTATTVSAAARPPLFSSMSATGAVSASASTYAAAALGAAALAPAATTVSAAARPPFSSEFPVALSFSVSYVALSGRRCVCTGSLYRLEVPLGLTKIVCASGRMHTWAARGQLRSETTQHVLGKGALSRVPGWTHLSELGGNQSSGRRETLALVRAVTPAIEWHFLLKLGRTHIRELWRAVARAFGAMSILGPVRAPAAHRSTGQPLRPGPSHAAAAAAATGKWKPSAAAAPTKKMRSPAATAEAATRRRAAAAVAVEMWTSHAEAAAATSQPRASMFVCVTLYMCACRCACHGERRIVPAAHRLTGQPLRPGPSHAAAAAAEIGRAHV